MSIFPITKAISNKDEWIIYVIMEAIIVSFFIWNYRTKKKNEVLYESDKEKINIEGSKEGLYDPGMILFSEITNVEEEKHDLMIYRNSGSPIRLKNLGRYRKDVFNEIKNRIVDNRN
jgi:hypothetical protein